MEEAQGLSERSIELCFEWVMIEDKGWGIAQLIEGLLCIHEALASIPRTEKKIKYLGDTCKMFKCQGTTEAVGELGLETYGSCLFRHVTKLPRECGYQEIRQMQSARHKKFS